MNRWKSNRPLQNDSSLRSFLVIHPGYEDALMPTPGSGPASSKLLTVLISGNITSDIFLEQDVAKDLNKLGWDHESLFNAYKGCVNLIYEWWNED